MAPAQKLKFRRDIRGGILCTRGYLFPPKTKLARGNPAYEICSEAREGRHDLVVMANRGLGEIKGYLMGSVSNRVVRHAGSCVLIVK